ncbi:MAG: hypothetical protein IT455_21265 [Planctomycetes bacterium]|nr:hypothetical protein [Planctomycetota bacterium]
MAKEMVKAPLRLGVMALMLSGGLMFAAPDAGANAKPPAPSGECQSAPAVVINGGSMTNTTNIDLSANGGTGVADASGGDNNVALQSGNDDGGVAASGNGGGADAGASGGAIAAQDINSGSNIGSAIAVGDTIGGFLCDGVPAVQVSGGTVTNETNISVKADGGTAIADASGGDNNVAVNGGRAGNGGVSGVSSVGNGGSADASANGGAISLGDINSGGNAGNVISVGNTISGGVVPVIPGKPSEPGKPGKPGGAITIKPNKAPKVQALPSTGMGVLAGESAPLAGMAAGILAAAVAAAGATRRRFR